jgi:hypothetical protein
MNTYWNEDCWISCVSQYARCLQLVIMKMTCDTIGKGTLEYI